MNRALLSPDVRTTLPRGAENGSADRGGTDEQVIAVPDVDFRRLQARAGNLRQRDLVRAAEACGWTHSRTTGGHMQFTKPGYRTLAIPRSLTSGTARGIIRALEESTRD